LDGQGARFVTAPPPPPSGGASEGASGGASGGASDTSRVVVMKCRELQMLS